jgi:hypothetical protein
MEPKWLYRLEAKDPNNGLWYNQKNELVWGIGKLENCKTKDLPMGYDERYHKDGRNWYSSCSHKEDLAHWYSLEDALELIKNGFVFTRYTATEYVEYENETTFIKETSFDREVLNIEDIWPSINKRDKAFLDRLGALFKEFGVTNIASDVDESGIDISFKGSIYDLHFNTYEHEVFTDVESMSEDLLEDEPDIP